jgi:peptide/nickel transport system substrate-binding protein
MNGETRQWSRRTWLAAAFGATASMALGIEEEAFAMGRTPVGGKLSLRVPWSLASMDPHDLRDPAAALFSHAVFDPLYAVDASNNPYASLATAMPQREGAGTVVRLREGLRTARGTALDARDVIFSIDRARARGGAALWTDLPKPAAHPGERLAITFGAADPFKLARALASPLFALVPRGFSASSPDGTGAFKAEIKGGKLTLTRNANAARGAAFLESVEVESAPDLKASLRQFEAERDDVGWLGMGLFGGRKNAVKFDCGVLAWIVLVTGSDAGAAGGAGAAQKLVNALPAERLGHLGLGALPAASGSAAWTGPKTELVVDESAPHLVEIANTLAPILSNPGHEVTALAVSRAEVAKRRGKAALLLDIVRPLGPGSTSTLLALASADDPARAADLVRHPPKTVPASARGAAALLKVGVIGEVRASGGAAPDVSLVKNAVHDGWDLGASYRRKAAK